VKWGPFSASSLASSPIGCSVAAGARSGLAARPFGHGVETGCPSINTSISRCFNSTSFHLLFSLSVTAPFCLSRLTDFSVLPRDPPPHNLGWQQQRLIGGSALINPLFISYHVSFFFSAIIQLLGWTPTSRSILAGSRLILGLDCPLNPFLRKESAHYRASS
jgi:hypothetical protein